MEASKPSALVRDLLIVDDDEIQVYLFKHFLSELGRRHRCHHAASGPEALNFLRRRGAYAEAPRPELIVLDVNMPGMDGCQVLSEIKGDPGLRSIPVVMFSLGEMPEDVGRCYHARANAYVRKPGDYDSCLHAIDQIERFWCQTVRLPGGLNNPAGAR